MSNWITCKKNCNIEISSDGQVRYKSYKKIVGGKTVTIPHRLLVPHLYGKYLYVNFDNKAHAIHQLVAEHFLTKEDDNQIVEFLSEDTTDCSSNNLKWVDRSEKMKKIRESTNYKHSSGKSIQIECLDMNMRFNSVKQCVKELQNHVCDAKINYDTFLRHMKKAPGDPFEFHGWNFRTISE